MIQNTRLCYQGFENQGIKMADATDCHGNWIFSGPAGIKPYSRYKLRDTSYVGHTTYSIHASAQVMSNTCGGHFGGVLTFPPKVAGLAPLVGTRGRTMTGGL